MQLDKEKTALIEFLLIIFLITATIFILFTMDLHPDLWIILIILLPVVIIPLSIIVHELSHILVMKFYTPIQISKLTREKNLLKQPIGKIFLAGYIGELIFSIILIIMGSLSLLINETAYLILGIMLLSLAVVVILHINRVRVSDEGDFSNYKRIKNILLEGCSCGSNEFNVQKEVICAKCGRILYKFKQIKGAITTLHLNPYYLFAKKKKEINYRFITDAPLKEIFNLVSSPIPKEYWKEFGIENVRMDSNYQSTTYGREFGVIITRILEKHYPSKLVIHITYELGFEVKETVELIQTGEQVEVRLNSISSVELLELPIRRATKKLYKKLIQEHLSKELGKKFLLKFYT